MIKICSGLLMVSLIFLYASCEVKPQAIDYGNDQCSACKMMIMDNRFGSELVTDKGKVYKYDAIECMARDVVKDRSKKYSFYLVSNFNHPGKFIDAQKAMFLIDPKRPSPMGAFLSAYETQEAIIPGDLSEGQILNWIQLLERFDLE